jgi:hypothetical protein
LGQIYYAAISGEAEEEDARGSRLGMTEWGRGDGFHSIVREKLG